MIPSLKFGHTYVLNGPGAKNEEHAQKLALAFVKDNIKADYGYSDQHRSFCVLTGEEYKGFEPLKGDYLLKKAEASSAPPPDKTLMVQIQAEMMQVSKDIQRTDEGEARQSLTKQMGELRDRLLAVSDTADARLLKAERAMKDYVNEVSGKNPEKSHNVVRVDVDDAGNFSIRDLLTEIRSLVSLERVSGNPAFRIVNTPVGDRLL